MAPCDIHAVARRLVAAHEGAPLVASTSILPPDMHAAYAVQDMVVDALGGIGGWKVGAKSALAEPGCSPLPRPGVHASGCTLASPARAMRGIEVEVGLRLGRDLASPAGVPDLGTLQAAVAAVVPVIEVVETRLADWRESGPLAQLADLQNHGALVVGLPGAIDPAAVDLRLVEAYLAFDGQPVASTRGANPAGDIWRLLGWLAAHCTMRGRPLRAGDVVTTGSCTGMLFAPEGSHVQAELAGIGRVELRF